MKKEIILFALTLLMSTAGYAQIQDIDSNQSQTNHSTHFEFQRLISLDEHKQEEEISVTIEEHTKNFELMIETIVNSGKLTIEIYDSNGKNQGTFSVGTQLNIKDSEEAKGHITKSLLEPQPGNWKIKIIPVSAVGMIKIKTSTFL